MSNLSAQQALQEHISRAKELSVRLQEYAEEDRMFTLLLDFSYREKLSDEVLENHWSRRMSRLSPVSFSVRVLGQFSRFSVARVWV